MVGFRRQQFEVAPRDTDLVFVTPVGNNRNLLDLFPFLYRFTERRSDRPLTSPGLPVEMRDLGVRICR